MEPLGSLSSKDSGNTSQVRSSCAALSPGVLLISLLHKFIDWQGVFRHFDSDRSGSIEGRELSDALRSFGYNLSPGMLTLIEHKYGTISEVLSSLLCKCACILNLLPASQPTVGYGPPPGITFDRFVRACVVVKTLTEAFQR